MENLIAQLDRHLRKSPALGRDVYIAKTAVVLGDVTLGDESSVWYGAVLRGDINRIEVGRGSNIQDNAVLHLSDDHPCVLGNHVTVGHSANVHACTIGDRCLIGMGATILTGPSSERNASSEPTPWSLPAAAFHQVPWCWDLRPRSFGLSPAKNAPA